MGLSHDALLQGDSMRCAPHLPRLALCQEVLVRCSCPVRRSRGRRGGLTASSSVALLPAPRTALVSFVLWELYARVSHAGAAEVVATDREPLALECALRSAAASGLRSVQPWGCQPDQAPAGAHGSAFAGPRAAAARPGAPLHQARSAL